MERSGDFPFLYFSIHKNPSIGLFCISLLSLYVAGGIGKTILLWSEGCKTRTGPLSITANSRMFQDTFLRARGDPGWGLLMELPGDK